MYESSSQGRDKTPAESPSEVVIQPEGESSNEEGSNNIPSEHLTKQVSQKTNEGGNNLIVIICVVALALALIPGLAFAWKKGHARTGLY